MKKIKTPSKKVAILLILILVICVVAVGYYLRNSRSNNTNTGSGAGEINLQPATAEDKKRADDNKQRIIEQDEQLKNQGQNTSSTSKKSVVPVITYADQYGSSVEVGAYINGVFEDGGTCTATFSKGSSSFSKTTTGVKNVNSVNCPALTAASSEFSSKGAWSVVISYSSDTAAGSSSAKQIEVR